MTDESSGHTVGESRVPCRIVFYAGPSGPIACVYPIDANRFSLPIRTVPVATNQELPQAEVGAVGFATADFTRIAIGDVEIVAISRVEEGAGETGMRVFAERGETLSWPGHGGNPAPWGEPARVGSLGLAEYEIRLDRSNRDFALAVVGLGAIVAAFVWAWIVDGTPPFLLACLGIGGIGTAWRSWRRARHSRAAIRLGRLVSDGPATRMTMRLWWAAGYGAGPIAIATLTAADGSGRPVDFEVIGVPAGFAAPAGTEVDVRGELTDPGGLTIQVGTTTLWSAGRMPAPAGERHNRQR